MAGRPMADYYPILARAVSSLPDNDVRARDELYARARMIVAEQLRKRDVKPTAQEMRREQAALDGAVRRLEAEFRKSRVSTERKPHSAPPRQNIHATDQPDRAKRNTARSLAKILDAVESNEAGGATPQPPARQPANAMGAMTRASPTEIATGFVRPAQAAPGIGRAPTSLGAMLFGITYIVAALAFTGVTYIRCIVWIYKGVIGYPILLAIMAVTLALFIVPPVMLFRKTSTLPTFDMLLRFLYSRSRRAH